MEEAEYHGEKDKSRLFTKVDAFYTFDTAPTILIYLIIILWLIKWNTFVLLVILVIVLVHFMQIYYNKIRINNILK